MLEKDCIIIKDVQNHQECFDSRLYMYILRANNISILVKQRLQFDIKKTSSILPVKSKYNCVSRVNRQNNLLLNISTIVKLKAFTKCHCNMTPCYRSYDLYLTLFKRYRRSANQQKQRIVHDIDVFPPLKVKLHPSQRSKALPDNQSASSVG